MRAFVQRFMGWLCMASTMAGRLQEALFRRDMKTPGKRESERLRTRSALMDATEALMREQGYASVSSRRVAERAGLKSQLVHYHFGSMEDLFLETYRRNSVAFFGRHLQALASSDPLDELWKFSRNPEGIELVMEFVAAANHHKSLRDEMRKSADEARMIRDAVISKSFNDRPTESIRYSPTVVSFLVAAVSRALNTEKMIGVTGGHEEIENFMQKILTIFRGDAG
jgi:AcrR family transcriptional regulator